jgi:replication-associated recombination protein RarA
MKPLYERRRPRTLAEVVGQPKACERAAWFMGRGEVAGNSFLILAPCSGVGKSTIARIMAESIAEPEHITVVCAREVSASFLDAFQTELEADRQSRRFFGDGWMGKGKPGRALIVEEMHGLSKIAVQRLDVILEHLPEHVAVFFTTVNAGTAALFEETVDGPMFTSRCHEIKLTNQGLKKSAAPYLRDLAQSEGLDGQPVEAYERLIVDCNGNLRKAIQRIQGGEMAVANA